MAVAAVTPRVRTVVVCDDVSPSETDYGVFTLENVRQHLQAERFPCRATLSVFMVLSSPRRGKYEGKVILVNNGNDRSVRYVKFVADFEEDNQVLPLSIEFADCTFPEAGQYSFEIHFSTHEGEALKGEHPLTVLGGEE
jgi:hypothetical protein